MTAFLQIGWTWYPSVLIGFGLWTLLYAWANRGRQTPLAQQVAFHLGTLAGLVALVSPLDELGDEYLFCAHMVQHLLLMLVTAPLWLIGTRDERKSIRSSISACVVGYRFAGIFSMQRAMIRSSFRGTSTPSFFGDS